MKRHKTRYAGVSYRLTAAGQRRYSISYKDSTGKRVWKTVEGNEKDALAALRDVKSRLHRGDRVVSSRLTVKELSDTYMRTQTGHLKPSTLFSYEDSLKFYVLPKLGHHRVTELTVNEVADFVAEMRQTYAANTIKNALKPLSRMFAYAMRMGWVSQNPVKQLDKPERPSGATKRMRVLSTDEINALLKVKSTYRLFFTVAIFSGLRKGELLRLRWEDIDLLAGQIKVAQEGDGKTAAATREVAIPPFLVQLLATASLEQGICESGLVFPFAKRNINRALDSALEKAKVEKVSVHELRHTFASVLIGLGMDVVYVSNQLGHANPAITLRIYSHLWEAQKRQEEAKTKMEEAFAGVVA